MRISFGKIVDKIILYNTTAVGRTVEERRGTKRFVIQISKKRMRA